MGLFGWKRKPKESEQECCRRAQELLEDDRQLEAVEWLEKAAQWGNGPAMFNLAVFYATGVGFGEDYEPARAWAVRAAKKGVTRAQELIRQLDERIEKMKKYTGAEWYNAGVHYEEEGEDCDFERAQFCYEQAARLGDVDGQYAAGIWRLGDSQGCVYELAQARYWLSKAAAAGHAQAQQSLDRMKD
jgi:TPR repeat protein